MLGMTTDQIIREKINKWKKDAEQYQRQVEEAKRKGLPHEQMLATAHALRSCANELDRELKMLFGKVNG